MKRIALLCVFAGAAWSADLTGNWLSAVPSPNNDGTVRRTYFSLKLENGRITGTVRATQLFYAVMESTGGPDGFKLTVGMQDGPTERRAIYEGRLMGDELHVAQRRGDQRNSRSK